MPADQKNESLFMLANGAVEHLLLFVHPTEDESYFNTSENDF